MKYPTRATTRNRTGRSRLAWQVSLVVGASAAAFAGSSFAAMSSSDNDMSNNTFRDKFMNQVVKGSDVHGRVGIYDFRRWNDTNKHNADNKSTAYGGWLHFHTGQIYGFSAGVGAFFEKAVYNPDSGHNGGGNGNLVGDDDSVEAITQLFLQYNRPGLQIRGGRQLLTIPFANNDRFTFNPRAYDGVSVVLAPLQLGNSMQGGTASSNTSQSQNKSLRHAPTSMDFNGYGFMGGPDAANGQSWSILGAKITKTKPRGAGEDFSDSGNLYGYETPGFWTLGTMYQNNTPNGNYAIQAYHHTFQTLENLEYIEGGFMANKSSSGFAPYVKAQYVRADDTGGQTVDIKSDLFGLKAGVNGELISAAVFGNFAPEHDGSFNHGQMIHPQSDLSTYIYTDTMNDGLQELGPGYALGGSLGLTPGAGFSFSTKFVFYHAKHGHSHAFYGQVATAALDNGSGYATRDHGGQDSWGLNVGVSYNFGALSPSLAGLHISDTLGVTHFSETGGDGTLDSGPNYDPTFYDNRIRFYYAF